MKELPELQELIIQWAKDKNLNDPDKQYLKCLEEIGETARAILKNDVPEIYDGIGDSAVTIIIYYWQKGLTVIKMSKFEYINEDDHNCFRYLIPYINGLSYYTLEILSNIAENHNTTLEECLNLAYNEIKDRQGKTVAGTFIKN